MDKVKMPRSLTAENGAKALMSGEFFEHVDVPCEMCDCQSFDEFINDGCDECGGIGTVSRSVPVRWTTIKEIYGKLVEHFGAQSEGVA